ncbi:MAG: FGGY-family carbohydrate kinase [Planctomycetota bacterium]
MIVPFAAVAALVMLAQLVAGRAARDALFLVTFGPDALPYAMAASGVVSVAGAIPLSRALARFGPGRAVPWLFAGSAGLFLLEWSLVDAQARVVAIVLYLHLAAASSLLISGFWGVLNERFDPHSARASLARVASFATAGGMLGGILSERTATYFGLDATLVVMAGMHGLCALLVGAVGRAETLAPKTALEEGEDESALALVRGSPYLRWMVATTLLLALLDAQIDFALRAGAAGELGSGESLVRFFGLYYTAVGVLTFAIQSGLTARIVGRFGIGPSMTAMPVSILLASVAALLVPGLPAYVVMHGAGSVLIHSIYRTGFELLYTPLPLRIKRPAKPLIDVGGDGVGDVLGAGMIVVVIAVAPHADLIGVTLLALSPRTDHSIAARTLAFDIHQLDWSEEVLGAAGLSKDLFAPPIAPGDAVGEVAAGTFGLPKGCVVAGGLHDQPAGILGAGVQPGESMLAIGTVICLGVRLREQPSTKEMVENNLCFYPTFGDGQRISIAYNFTGGSLLKWYRDHLAGEELELAKTRNVDPYEIICDDLPDDPTNLFVLPHFSMTGTPWLDPKALGSIIGLRLTTERKEIVKALLEGILFEIKLNTELLGNAGVGIDAYKAIGGAARSKTWMQIAADILGRPIKILSVSEVAGLGAALMGARGAGIISSEEEAYELASNSAQVKTVIEPRPAHVKRYQERYEIYKDLYPTTRELSHRISSLS